MRPPPRSKIRGLVLLCSAFGACAAAPGVSLDASSGAGTGGVDGAGGAAAAGTGGRSDTGGAAGGGAAGAGGTAATGGSGPGGTGVTGGGRGGGTGGAAGGGAAGSTAPGSGGGPSTGGASGSAGLSGTAGTGEKGGAGGKGGAGASGCSLPSTVSFQKDVQPFLIKTCGSSGSDGCHVIDGASTMAQGGFDHAYDWITAGAHPSSCPEKPAPLRFQVVIAVIESADPSTCSKSRQMPPPNATGGGLRTPLGACEVATLQAWLDEPLVTQMHRADDSSPTTPYPMPPFN